MRYYTFLLILLTSVMLTSCELIGDIFGAGFYMGIFISVLVIAVVIYLIYKVFKR